MTIGEKIKFIRKFRGLTQKELGTRIGFDEKGADNRVAQYETNYRVPKKDTLLQIAKVLDVNPSNFISEISGPAEDIIQTLLWLDEDNPDAINLFQFIRKPEKCHSSIDTTVCYYDSDDWPVLPPVGLWFKFDVLDDFMQEWLVKKNQLKAEKITREEYLEWKLNWPDTCEDKKEQKK